MTPEQFDAAKKISFKIKDISQFENHLLETFDGKEKGSISEYYKTWESEIIEFREMVKERTKIAIIQLQEEFESL